MAPTAATPNEGSPADVLDAGCLAEIFGRLTDAGLCRVRSVGAGEIFLFGNTCTYHE